MPVPVRASVVGEFCALLAKVSVALAAPVLCGVNVIVKGALWPAGMVAGKVRPLKAKAELFVPADVTVTLAPLAVKLPDADPLVPTTTLPRGRVAGETASCPAAEVPVPESAMVNDGSDAVDVTTTSPAALAAEVGVKTTWKLVPWPAPRVIGVVAPLKLNPVPLIAI